MGASAPFGSKPFSMEKKLIKRATELIRYSDSYIISVMYADNIHTASIDDIKKAIKKAREKKGAK